MNLNSYFLAKIESYIRYRTEKEGAVSFLLRQILGHLSSQMLKIQGFTALFRVTTRLLLGQNTLKKEYMFDIQAFVLDRSGARMDSGDGDGTYAISCALGDLIFFQHSTAREEGD